jgi:hypothetical protein
MIAGIGRSGQPKQVAKNLIVVPARLPVSEHGGADDHMLTSSSG